MVMNMHWVVIKPTSQQLLPYLSPCLRYDELLVESRYFFLPTFVSPKFEGVFLVP